MRDKKAPNHFFLLPVPIKGVRYSYRDSPAGADDSTARISRQDF